MSSGLTPLYMCLIDTWGMLRGVPVASRVLTGWLSKCLPLVFGLAFDRGACRLVFSAVAWLERGESTLSRIRFARCGLRIRVKGQCYECDDWY